MDLLHCLQCNLYCGLQDEEQQNCQQHPLRVVSFEAALLNVLADLGKDVRRVGEIISNYPERP